MTKSGLQFKLEFSDEEMITPFGGLGLYGELYKTMGIERDVEGTMPGPGSGSGYKANTYVYPLAMMFIGGGRYIEDIRRIESDGGLRKLRKLEEVPSSDAVGDWLKRDSMAKIEGLGKVNDEVTRRILKRAGETLTLDIDATGIEASKAEAAWTYKGH